MENPEAEHRRARRIRRVVMGFLQISIFLLPPRVAETFIDQSVKKSINTVFHEHHEGILEIRSFCLCDTVISYLKKGPAKHISWEIARASLFCFFGFQLWRSRVAGREE